MSEATLPADYSALLGEIKERIRAAQYQALRAVNKELVRLNWDIGQIIVERQTNAVHGAAIVEQLARDLQREFPGIRASPGATSSICESFTSPTGIFQKCNHWLHKSDGLTT